MFHSQKHNAVKKQGFNEIGGERTVQHQIQVFFNPNFWDVLDENGIENNFRV